MFRHLALGPLDNSGMPWINSKMPNRKTDTNNRTGFSTDFIGQNWNWPEASYAEREKILAAHLKYQQGLMWTLANHPRVPEKIRREVSRSGRRRAWPRPSPSRTASPSRTCRTKGSRLSLTRPGRSCRCRRGPAQAECKG